MLWLHLGGGPFWVGVNNNSAPVTLLFPGLLGRASQRLLFQLPHQFDLSCLPSDFCNSGRGDWDLFYIFKVTSRAEAGTAGPRGQKDQSQKVKWPPRCLILPSMVQVLYDTHISSRCNEKVCLLTLCDEKQETLSAKKLLFSFFWLKPPKATK